MPDIQKVVQTKEKIIETIKTKGPSYPALISREVGLSPLFAAAFLSELVKERKLKISNMKVGSSPIYYIEGQGPQLEKFSEYLNHKEKESLFKLKESQMLQDETQEPAIRVSLRKIKDFAIPMQIRINGETKLFWRYFQFPESETREKIRLLLNTSNPSQIQKKEPKEQSENQEPQTTNQEDNQKQIIERKGFESPLESKAIDKGPKEQIKPKKPQISAFAETIKDYLATKKIEIIDELSIKKKEFIAKVRMDALFGKQEFYLISKEKKKVSQNDLTIAIQTAQSEKMPALFLSPGELDKNAKRYIQEWRNIIKFDKVKL